jgi:hypothetical protein
MCSGWTWMMLKDLRKVDPNFRGVTVVRQKSEEKINEK